MAWHRCRVCTKMQLDPVEKSSCEVPFVAETKVLYLGYSDNMCRAVPDVWDQEAMR